MDRVVSDSDLSACPVCGFGPDGGFHLVIHLPSSVRNNKSQFLVYHDHVYTRPGHVGGFEICYWLSHKWHCSCQYCSSMPQCRREFRQAQRAISGLPPDYGEFD